VEATRPRIRSVDKESSVFPIRDESNSRKSGEVFPRFLYEKLACSRDWDLPFSGQFHSKKTKIV